MTTDTADRTFVFWRLLPIFIVAMTCLVVLGTIVLHNKGNASRQAEFSPAPSQVIVLPSETEKINKLIAMPRTFFFEKPENLAICKAIDDRDIQSLDELIASGVDLNVQEKGGITVLFWGFMQDNLKAFVKLLERGANPDLELEYDVSLSDAFSGRVDPNPKRPNSRTFGYGNESLLFAIVTKWTIRQEFVEPALSRSRNTSQHGMTGATLLHRSAWLYADPRLIEILLKYDIDLNIKDDNGETACIAFLGRGKYAACLLLLEHGADPSVTDKEGKNLQTHLNNLIQAYADSRNLSRDQLVATIPSAMEDVQSEGTLGIAIGDARLQSLRAIQNWLDKKAQAR